VVPERVVGCVRNAGVEARPGEDPAAGGGDDLGEALGVEVGIRVAKRLPGGVEEVLAVDESDHALGRGLDHCCSGKRKTPAEAVTGVSDGE
jgi:hypothetical protein